MNIMVTAIGSFAGDIVIKSLRRDHYVIGCDVFPKEWIVDAFNVDVFVQAPLAKDKDNYVRFIKSACNKYAVQFIIPLTDPEVDILSEIKDELLGRGVCVCASDYEVTRLCRDKYLLPLYLSNHKIGMIIPTSLLSVTERNILDYPVLAKPRYGRSSEGVIKILSGAEMEYVRQIAWEQEYVIQPFISGNIITVDVVRDLCNNMACIARCEHLRNPYGAGITVEIINEPALISICMEIANLLGIIGAVNMEFIESDEKTYLLEINPRFSGGVEFSHIAGYDVVANHLRCFTGHKIETEVNIKRMIITRKYEEYVTKVL